MRREKKRGRGKRRGNTRPSKRKENRGFSLFSFFFGKPTTKEGKNFRGPRDQGEKGEKQVLTIMGFSVDDLDLPNSIFPRKIPLF